MQALCTSKIQTAVSSRAPSMSVKPLSRELPEASGERRRERVNLDIAKALR